MEVEEAESKFSEAVALEKEEPEKAVSIYKEIISKKDVGEEAIKEKENSIFRMAELYATLGWSEELYNLLSSIRDFLSVIPKAKTAKLVKTIIDLLGKIPNTLEKQIQLCKESIEWTKTEKRTFLRQRIETRLSSLYFEKKEYTHAISLINRLLREVRKFDDKPLLLEIHLTESRVYHALKNLPKARAALTSARTTANSIYCPPLLQAQIDMQSGILHAEEGDYKTAYSYFFEAYEGYNTLEDAKTVTALKYMLLCKIMSGGVEDVPTLLNTKSAIKYSGRDLDAMRGIASAYKQRSLKEFEKTNEEYHDELTGDSLIHNHLSDLYNNLLEENLLRLIEPFSRVQLSHISKLISLPREVVESTLSKMILDKKFNGILDEGTGCLIIFDEQPVEKMYESSVDVVKNMNKVVDQLFHRAQKIHS